LISLLSIDRSSDDSTDLAAAVLSVDLSLAVDQDQQTPLQLIRRRSTYPLLLLC
jgi:hypothetical protein